MTAERLPALSWGYFAMIAWISSACFCSKTFNGHNLQNDIDAVDAQVSLVTPPKTSLN
jgi:hypothetical protein